MGISPSDISTPILGTADITPGVRQLFVSRSPALGFAPPCMIIQAVTTFRSPPYAESYKVKR